MSPILPALVLLLLAAMTAPSEARQLSSEIALTALESRKACLQFLKDVRSQCEFRIWAKQGWVSFRRVDVNGDGRRDLIVRQVSLFHCGTAGCSTNIYVRDRINRLRAPQPLVAYEPIVRCEMRGRKGLRFTTSKGRGPCITF